MVTNENPLIENEVQKQKEQLPKPPEPAGHGAMQSATIFGIVVLLLIFALIIYFMHSDDNFFRDIFIGRWLDYILMKKGADWYIHGLGPI